jgi:hypothetical protein
VPKRQKTVKVKPINGLEGPGLLHLAGEGMQPDGIKGGHSSQMQE